MAIQESRFLTGLFSDQKYPTDAIAEHMRKRFTNGVWAADNSLKVSLLSQMTIQVSPGDASVQGFLFRIKEEDGPMHIKITPSSLPRIDRVIIRLDQSISDIFITIKQGTPSASPSAPSLTRTSGIYEISLAQIAVAANATSITSTNITDERNDTSVCGITTLKYKSDIPITESGTWKPVFAGSTTAGTHVYEDQSGSYNRVGNIVIISARIAVTTKDTSMSGNIEIRGFPFAPTSNNNCFSLGYYRDVLLPISESYSMGGYIRQGTTYGSLFFAGRNGGYITAAHINSSPLITLSGYYAVA